MLMWNYFDTKEVCKIPKVLNKELLGKKIHKALDHDNIVICDNNIINIYKTIYSFTNGVEDK